MASFRPRVCCLVGGHRSQCESRSGGLGEPQPTLTLALRFLWFWLSREEPPNGAEGVRLAFIETVR